MVTKKGEAIPYFSFHHHPKKTPQLRAHNPPPHHHKTILLTSPALSTLHKPTSQRSAIALSSAAHGGLQPGDPLISTPSPRPPAPLYKQKSWSPDISRDEAWRRRKGNSKNRRRSKSVTEDDVEELKGCIDLGFGFESPEVDDPRLSDTLPALELFYAVNKYYNDAVNSKSSPLILSAAAVPDVDGTPSPVGSPHTIFGPGDNPQTVKTRLRQWAQVVACSVRQWP